MERDRSGKLRRDDPIDSLLKDRRYVHDGNVDAGNGLCRKGPAEKSASDLDFHCPYDCSPPAADDRAENILTRRKRGSLNDALADVSLKRTGLDDSCRPRQVTAAQGASSAAGGSAALNSSEAGSGRRWRVRTGHLFAIGIILCVVILLAVLLALLFSNRRPTESSSLTPDRGETTPFACEACEPYSLDF